MYTFDALILGGYQGDRLMFVSKLRNGFTPQLRVQTARTSKGLEVSKSFVNLPEKKGSARWEPRSRQRQ